MAKVRRVSRSGGAVALLALVMSAGCYESDFPLDPAPREEIDQSLLGTWRCLPFNANADEDPATMRVKQGAERRYDVTWQEGAKEPDRYEGFTSAVRGTPFVNIGGMGASGETGSWVFLRPTLLRPNVLQLQIVDSKAMKGVENSPPAIRRAIERQLSKAALTVDFCVCVRANEPTEPDR